MKKQDSPSNNYLAITLATLALTILALVFPSLLRDQWQSSAFKTGVMAASGDKFVLSEPVKVFSTPQVVVQSGTLSLVRDDGKSTTVGQALFDLLTESKAGLLIDGATISINTMNGIAQETKNKTPATRSPPTLLNSVAPLLEALTRRFYRKLSITRSTLILTSPGRPPLRITNLTANVVMLPGSSVSASGQADINGETITFDGHLGLDQDFVANNQLPLAIELESSFMQSKIKGKLKIGNTHYEISAPDADFVTSDLVRLSRWLNLKLPIDHAPRKFQAVGDFHWVENKLSLNNAEFKIDESSATGVLTLDLKHKRPMLDGTLAADTLYLTTLFFGHEQEASTSIATRLTGLFDALTDNGKTFLTQIDADLRLSASKVVIAPLTLGATAAALSLRNGELMADIAEVVVDENSRGMGQISADTRTSPITYNFHGRLENQDLAPLGRLLLGENFLTGRADVTLALKGSGKPNQSLLHSLTGDLTVKSRPEENTHISFKFPSEKDILVNTIDKTAQIKDDWHDTFKKQSTEFSELEANLRVDNGVFIISQATGLTTRTKHRAEGSFVPSRKQLDIRLVTRHRHSDDKKQNNNNEEVRKNDSAYPRCIFKFVGFWHDPHISVVQYPKKSAASATTIRFD